MYLKTIQSLMRRSLLVLQYHLALLDQGEDDSDAEEDFSNTLEVIQLDLKKFKDSGEASKV